MNETFPRPDSGCLRAALLRRVAQIGFAAALVALPLAGFAPAAHAERADRDKPLNIEADNMTYDDLKQKNIFIGHVVATKGTIVIKADRVEVTQDPQGYQYATGTSTGKDLSYFRQKRDGLDEYIEGNAVRIDYDGKQDLTTLTNRAVVRRLQGLTKIQDEVRGSVITYDGQKDFYTATAGKDVAGPGNPTGRVRAMLAPRNGGAAPLTGASATLAPSNTIQGTPQQ
ncbi:LptA, protein essential for LPS transport across the periplasm [Caballeronia glathei]|jgi:lipopolysaccharide export system protein LptA|uniref:Lipopolysaccharide export system protein LptA n=1 Tax=Caballeronia glathei TaxID=60547 RepID=A0A069Q4X7_9BURK|nr:lipopolysaccharide transport periplasmic protein LptA [Caballeronia glathei]KDR44816.1 organic solvent tolerance protein OstA [Caballeronia glathei]CEJ96303.1 LptA, protein essential for LPS transport across the periplasm [Caballeronia glathei]